MRKVGLILVIVGLLVFVSCGKEPEEAVTQEPEAAPQEPETAADQGPERVTVQHILISFKGSAIPDRSRSFCFYIEHRTSKKDDDNLDERMPPCPIQEKCPSTLIPNR